MFKKLSVIAVLGGWTAWAAGVYSNNFNTTIAGGFASGATGSLTSTLGNLQVSLAPNGSQSFLGTNSIFFNSIGNETVTLALSNLPGHTTSSVSFDLYLFNNWFGTNPTFGMGQWRVRQDGSDLLFTSFSLFPGFAPLQEYPDAVGGPTHPALTGAKAVCTLSDCVGANLPSAIYSLSFTFAHTSSSLAIDFIGLQPFGNGNAAGYGIDNLVVNVDNPGAGAVPEPASVTLALVGLGGLFCARRRLKRP